MLLRRVRGQALRSTILALIASLTLSACQIGDGSVPEEELAPPGGSGTTGSSPAPGTTAVVAGQAVTPTPASEDTPLGSSATTAGGAANIAVGPSEVTLGNVVLSFSVGAAQPMNDPSRIPTDAAQADARTASAQPQGYIVLGGSTLKVTNNFDGAQSAPADQPLEMLRHVALQVKDKQSGQLIPHVNVTMDLLREGRPVLQNQPLVPMVPSGGAIGQMQYGNNVKFPGKGDYQVFVRLESSPLLGGSAGVAQFNLSIK